MGQSRKASERWKKRTLSAKENGLFQVYIETDFSQDETKQNKKGILSLPFENNFLAFT